MLYEVITQKHINKSLEIVNEKLSTNGIYIGCVESYSLRRTRLVGKMGILFYVIGPLDFISKRIIPKIRKLNSVQEFVTRGKRRAISNTEAMGRLVRAGFEMIDFKEINGLTWYVGHKVSKPRMDHKPNYGLIYKKNVITSYSIHYTKLYEYFVSYVMYGFFISTQ